MTEHGHGRRLLARAARARATARRACGVAVKPLQVPLQLSGAARDAAKAVLEMPASVLLLMTSITLPIITFAAAFSVTNQNADATQIWVRKGYFLSAAIDLPPAAGFGSLGLTIALAAFVAVAVVRHQIVDYRLRTPREGGVSLLEASPHLATTHAFSLTAAFTAALGGHGVAAYQHQVSQFWHNSFAACFVLCALLHFALESHLERAASLSSRLARAWRLSLVIIATLGCATFISHVIVEEMHKTPIGIGKLAAAGAEILTCLCYLAYLATYSRSFHETRITLAVDLRDVTTSWDTPSTSSPAAEKATSAAEQ